MSSSETITVSAPGKVHILGEHTVVYGKPAIIASLDLRLRLTIMANKERARFTEEEKTIVKVIEPIIKKKFKIKSLPNYLLKIESQLPIGSGLGSSAAVSSAYIAALLNFLKISWDKDLLYQLTFEAEKIFQGNPSGGDQSPIIYGGLIWFRKETPTLKIIHRLQFTIPSKLSKNFVLINTGRPEEITAEMVSLVKNLYNSKPELVSKILGDQERLVKELLPVLKEADEKEFMRIIRKGERNLETIGVVGKKAKNIIRKIEKSGGAGKIIGAGGVKDASGMLLCYHRNKKVLEEIAKLYNLPYFQAKLGVEGLRQE